jgi:predicted permease
MTPRSPAVRAYRALLRLLPADFRARHAREMERVFEEMWRGRRGFAAGARVWLEAVWDVVRTAWMHGAGGREGGDASASTRGDGEGTRGGNIMDDLLQDLRYAARQLAHRPGFAAVLVLTLALGIGANTAVFSVVDGVLLRPLPYPEPDRLTVVWTQFPPQHLMEFPASWPEYTDYRTQSRSFSELAAWMRAQRTVTGGDDPERLDVVLASWELFPVLGVQPALGRAYGEKEDVAGNANFVVLSHGLWERRYGSDPSIIGRTIEMDGQSREVLGVMPRGFAFPDADVQAWLPVGIDPTNPPGRGNHFANLVGRLAPGVTLAQASSELEALMVRWGADKSLQHTWTRGEGPRNHPAFLRSLQDQTVGNVRQSLYVMLGAVGLVLLIACANVANLLLVRGEARLREISIRTAIGAARGRIIRQLITESLLLAAAGGAVGLGIARLGLSGLLALAPADLPRTDSIHLDGSVLIFSAAVAILSGLLFGLAPAVQTVRMDVQGALRDEGRSGTAGRGRFRYRQLLVVSQTSLAVLLLVGAGLLIRSFWQLNSVDPGFKQDGVLSASVSLPAPRYPQWTDVTGFLDDLLPKVRAIPGVTAAGIVRAAPLTGPLPPNDINFESRPTNPDDPPLNVDMQVVSAGYFQAMGIPLLQGRAFDGTDNATSELVSVVDEAFASEFFPHPADAIGQRVRQSGYDEYTRIVGIVGDVRQESLTKAPRAQMYLLHAQTPRTWYPLRNVTLVLRTDGDPLGLVSALRGDVKALDANLPVYQVSTVAQSVARSTSKERFSMSLQAVFAGLALVLAMIGIYGVLSYSVAQRTREIGIRMALGAERRSILNMVVSQGMSLVMASVVIGLGTALAGARVMSTLLFGVSPWDPMTYGAVAAVLVAVALAACWIPARRASAVTPQNALRFE